MATNYRQVAAQFARQYHLPVSVFLAQIQQESGFDPSAHSSAGADGIAQFIPSTAKAYGVNTKDPISSLKGAAKYDANLLKQYGSVQAMLSAYNSGRPNAYKDPNFAKGQTFNYVRNILAMAKKNGGGTAAPVEVPPAAPSSSSPSLGGDSGGMTELRAGLLQSLLQQTRAFASGQKTHAPSAPSLLSLLQSSGASSGTPLTGSIPSPAPQPSMSSTSAVVAGGPVKLIGDSSGIKSKFLSAVEKAVADAGGKQIKITSGFRTPEHNAAVGGAAHSNHMTGDALDGYALVNGQWVPLGQLLARSASKYGLRSGASFQWGGKPDIVHVDDGFNQG